MPGGGGGWDPDPGFRMLERLPVVNKGTCMCTSMHSHNIIMFLLTIRNSNSYAQALPMFI